MSGLINELLDVLHDEAALYEDLVQLAKTKKTLVIANDTHSLKDLNDKENGIAGKIQRSEKKRLGLIKDIANVLNEKESAITLASLADRMADQPESEEMRSVAQRLKKSLAALKELNEQNRTLIENALAYVDFSINLIRGATADAPIYAANGEEISAGRNLFDVKN
jgi:flagellar biosynthesis/type III secretory pathway chaperone